MELMAFFEHNNKNKESCHYLYQEFLEQYVYLHKNRNRNQDKRNLQLAIYIIVILFQVKDII